MLLKLLFIVFFASTILCSCKNSDKNYDQKNSSINQTTGCPPKNIFKLPDANITGVDIFMDASSSMKDFMPSKQPSTDFQKLIPDFISRLSSDFPGFSFYTLILKNAPQKKIDLETIKKQIAIGTFDFGNSSPLPIMLDTVLSNMSTNKLSVLITDGIYTPTGNINLREQAVSDIRLKVLKAQSRGLALTCIGVKSQFGKIISPYYLIVAGSPQNISVFKEKLKNSFSSINANIFNKEFSEISFGYPDINPFYSIIPYVENTGAGELAPCPEWDNRYLLVENIKIKDDPEYWIGINLTACPDYAKEIIYLENNLIIENKGLKSIRTGKFLTKAQFITKLQDEEDKRVSNDCTHFFRIKITEMQDDKGEIELSLKKTDPTWITEWNHDDSRKAEYFREKTYGLSNMIAGFKDAYSTKETGFFFKTLKIVITK